MDDVLKLWPIAVILLFVAMIVIRVNRNARNRACATGAGVPGSGPFLPIPEYRGPLAFFRRHLNGDYSLARSYWVNAFLISLFAPLLGMLLLPLMSENLPARYASVALLLLTALGILASCWAAAGTWASATKHPLRGGKRGWAALAKLAILVGLSKTFTNLSGMVPAIEQT